MADNVTTVLGLDPAGALSLADVLYIIQGTAEDRDRYLTLEKLRDFIQVNWDGAKITMENTTIVAEDDYFKVTGIGGNTKMDGGNIVVTATGGSATLSNDELSFTDGTNTSSYGASAAKVGNVTVSKTGVTVSGSGGSSTLENGKLSFVGSGTSSSFSASGLSIVYGGMTLTAINDSTGTYFGISGTGGGTRIYQDSITITGNGQTTSVGYGEVNTGSVVCNEMCIDPKDAGYVDMDTLDEDYTMSAASASDVGKIKLYYIDGNQEIKVTSGTRVFTLQPYQYVAFRATKLTSAGGTATYMWRPISGNIPSQAV